MTESRWARVSTPAGHFTVPRAVFERAGSTWRELTSDALDKYGKPVAPKLRSDVEDVPATRKRASKPRGNPATATPTPTEPKAPASDESEESE